MTKLEKLKAARDAARDAYSAALTSEYVCDAAAYSATRAAARDASSATYAAFAAARDDYEAELKKTKEQTHAD